MVLRRLRDEAHRFAVAYNRRLRARRMRESALDEIPGVGPAKKQALLAAFGSVRRLASAPLAAVAAVPGIGETLARSVVEWLASGANPPADGEVNQAGQAPERSRSSK